MSYMHPLTAGAYKSTTNTASHSYCTYTGRMALRLVTMLVVLTCVGRVITANGQLTHEGEWLASYVPKRTGCAPELLS